MIDKINKFMDDLEYVDFLHEERQCIIEEAETYDNKKLQERQLEKAYKKNTQINKTCGKYFRLFVIGYTREEVAKKLKVKIKTVEKFFDLWVF